MTRTPQLEGIINGPNGIVAKQQLRSIIRIHEENERQTLRTLNEYARTRADRTELWLRSEKLYQQEIKDLRIKVASYEEMILPKLPRCCKC